MWLEDFNECLVSRVRKILLTAGFVGKRHDEAVGQPLVEVFGTIVGAPFEVLDRVDLCWQFGKRSGDFLDVGFAGRLLELEHDDMTQQARLFDFLAGIIRERRLDQHCEDTKECAIGHRSEIKLHLHKVIPLVYSRFW